MKILLDSSAYIELYGGNKSAAGFLESAHEIYINPVFLGELRSGMLKGLNAAKRRANLERFLSLDRVVIIPIDNATSDVYAELAQFLKESGTPIPTNDIWMAASAMQYGLKVLTADKHFLKIPQVMKEVFEVDNTATE
ncbi:MAG: type II toxin-antitoxin system VapC family toxin [Syntrophales bacterium]|jgi:predicted nucleic acid-binding protein